MKKIKVGVALGGGGLCGVAHIGFLKALEKHKIKIDMISGISMGSIIGGLYASGMTISEMEQKITKITKGDIIELNFFKMLKESIFTGKRIERTLNKYLKVKTFEETKIKFITQALDLKSGKIVTFEKGNLIEAMRASSAIPGLISPVYKDDTIYVDGGVLQNIPYNILKEKGADVVIAVNCLNDYSLKETPKNIFSLLINSFNVMLDDMWKYQKEKYSYNYDIFCNNNTPEVSAIDINLKQIGLLIESGFKAGESYVKQIKEIIKNKKKIKKF